MWVGANCDMSCVDIRGAQGICMGGDRVNVSDLEGENRVREKEALNWEKMSAKVGEKG